MTEKTEILSSSKETLIPLSDDEVDLVAGGLFNINNGNVGSQQAGLVNINNRTINLGNISLL